MEKRILFIDEDPGRAGATVSLEYLVKGFSERGFDVYVLTSKTDNQSKIKLRENASLIQIKSGPIHTLTLHVHFTFDGCIFSLNGLSLIFKDLIKMMVGLFLYAKAIKKYKPDLIYLNEYSVIQASIIATLMRIPSVTHIRSLMLSGSYGIRKYFLSKLILGFNKKIFAITEIEAKQLNPPKSQNQKIYIVPEFFPFSSKTIDGIDCIKKSFGLSLDKIVVTMLGGILDIKGSIDFLRAAVDVSSKFQNVIFVLAGKNYLDNSLRIQYYNDCLSYIDILKKTNSIVTLGEITNSLELIKVSDILVSASIQTHFARPVIEAWGFGKPVIVAETSHTKNLVNHEINGLVYTCSNYEELSNCMIQLIESEGMRVKLGDNGKKIVEEKYDSEKNLQFIVDQCNLLIQ